MRFGLHHALIVGAVAGRGACAADDGVSGLDQQRPELGQRDQGDDRVERQTCVLWLRG